MILEIFTVCKRAISIADQFRISDTFDEFKSASVPLTVDFDVVVRVRFEAYESSDAKRVLSLRLFDQNGMELSRSQAIDCRLHPHRLYKTNSAGFVFHFLGACFEEFGEYTLVFCVGSVAVSSIPLFVSPKA